MRQTTVCKREVGLAIICCKDSTWPADHSGGRCFPSSLGSKRSRRLLSIVFFAASNCCSPFIALSTGEQFLVNDCAGSREQPILSSSMSSRRRRSNRLRNCKCSRARCVRQRCPRNDALSCRSDILELAPARLDLYPHTIGFQWMHLSHPTARH